MSKPLHIAIDGNEANIRNRVGSNVYAFEILASLEKITREDSNITVTVLLRDEPISVMPEKRSGWEYKVLKPRKLWTQWALPLHLFLHRNTYDLLYSPGHYAPHICPIPYVSSVMDTAYLEYPEYFNEKDRLQLTNWTERAVKKAKKVIAISEATKTAVMEHYHRKPNDVVVAYPAFTLLKKQLNKKDREAFFEKQTISQPYILFVGTLQPRKNITTLVEAFEIFSRKIASSNVTSKTSRHKSPNYKPAKLVLAGKVGWLADDILARIKASPMKERIILTGFVSEAEKQTLYNHAFASVLIGLYEGFGIPPLESLAHKTPPIVSNTTSLPEVVGEAGYTVEPTNPQAVADAMWQTYTMTKKDEAAFKRQAKKQLNQFSWEKSARAVLASLQSIRDNQST